MFDYVGQHPTQVADPGGLAYESLWTKAQWEEFQKLRQQLKKQSGLSDAQAWAVAASIVDIYFVSGQKRDRDRSGYGLPNWSDILFPKKGQRRSGVGISSKRKDYEDEVLGRLRKESGDTVDMGCVGLATVRQGADSGKRRSTACFTSIAEATAFKCPDGDSPFIYAVQGHPKDGKWPPEKDETGKITKNAGDVIEVTQEGHFNFATYVNGLWEYMNQGNPAVIKDAGCSRQERETGRADQRVVVSPELPTVEGWQNLYCVDCLID